MRSFISTDTELSTEKILNQYINRWKIEVFFRQNKMDLGFDNYQIRSKQAIKRFWILTQLAYFYCIFGMKNEYWE